MISNNILSFAKSILCEVLQPGSICVDATVGNGYDTVFLSEKAGASGHVFGFDIQEDAVTQTEQRLNEECQPENWTIFHSGHENMLELIPAEFHGRVNVVMFNLGFLPGSDKTVITKSDTTLEAIKASLEILARGGMLCIAIYAGHPGGDEEDVAVREYCNALDYHAFRVIQSEMVNKPGYPIRMLLITKL